MGERCPARRGASGTWCEPAMPAAPDRGATRARGRGPCRGPATRPGEFVKVAHGSAGSGTCPMNLELRHAETPRRPSDEVIVVPGKARRLKKPERSSSYVRISEG